MPAVHVDDYYLAYLYKRKEMWVVLHLPARKLKTAFLLPTVKSVGREALMELLKDKRMINGNVHLLYLQSVSLVWVM